MNLNYQAIKLNNFSIGLSAFKKVVDSTGHNKFKLLNTAKEKSCSLLA